MPNYTIQGFWQNLLKCYPIDQRPFVQGWSVIREPFQSFVEAPLQLNSDLSSDSDPTSTTMILVSAPGAVGKSTLARQIAFKTHAIYIDLALTEPVGGNTVTGGLVKSGIYNEWKNNETTLLIDGLDEARLRVTQEAFEAFLNDITQLCYSRQMPIVLFGRTGSIQDTWLILNECSANMSILEIGYYGPDASLDFVEARVRAQRGSGVHDSTRRSAANLLLEKLRTQTEADGDRFAGYAPVLQAVAARVLQENNPAALIAQVESGAQPITLKSVASSILERERGKLNGLGFDDVTIKDKLYTHNEQLDRLVARVYNLPPPPLPVMKPSDAQIYSRALETWVGEHPFLDGGSKASSAVFDAIISVRALKNQDAADAAIKRELARGARANPFLSEFYLPDDGEPGGIEIPPEHVGVVYASLRSRLSLGDAASLSIEGAEDAEGAEALRAEVEITLARRDVERPRVLRFSTEQTGILRLGRYIEDVELMIPYSAVEIGPGPEAIFVAPVNIQCEKLVVSGERVIIESAPDRRDASVFLEASEFHGATITTVPVLRGDVSLGVAWPGARSYPWNAFATEPTQGFDPRVDEGLRRFRKFVIAFRSHSRGSLARYRYKIEHTRMTKGCGQAVLDLMTTEGILILVGNMYYLDQDKLYRHTKTTYADCMRRTFSQEAISFVSRAIRS